MAYLSQLITFTLGIASVLAYSISTESSVIHKKQGESVTLMCGVAGDDWVPVSEPLTWWKIQNGEERQMLNLFQQLEPFVGERFEKPTVPDPLTSVNPQIRDLQPEDSGIYRCKVGDLQVEHTLWIYEEIDSLAVWGYKDINNPPSMPSMETETPLTYEEGQAGFVECRAVGGIPPPILRLIDTSTDRPVTTLPATRELNITGDVQGLKTMHYVSSIKHESLNLDHSSDGHKLRCEARVGDLEELSLNVERTMNLLYKPFIAEGDCEDTYNVKLGANRKITCMFFAKPSPTKAIWYNTADGKEIEEEYELVEDNKWAISLKLSAVTYSQLGVYELRVENSIGNLQHSIDVREGEVETGESTSDGNHTQPHALLVCSSFFLFTIFQRS